MPRRVRLLSGLAVGILLVGGCSNSPATPASGSAPGAPPSRSGSGSIDAGGPLLEGLDVCSLATPDQVDRVSGVPGDPTNRELNRIPAYGALVDQCGFGVSFDSSTFLVSVGLAPASRKELARQPGKPVDGIGDAARSVDSADSTTVSFLKGTTLVQLRASKKDGTDRTAQLVAVAAEVAARVPSDPPETDEQTTGLCDGVDPAAVRGVLRQEPGVSRSFGYPSGSATCSWATGAVDARAVTVTVYTSPYAGPFLADLRGNEPTAEVPGITGAFSIPGVAYAIAQDGQAVSVGGTFPPEAGRRKPLPVTPQLKAMLSSAVSLLR